MPQRLLGIGVNEFLPSQPVAGGGLPANDTIATISPTTQVIITNSTTLTGTFIPVWPTSLWVKLYNVNAFAI